MKNKVEHEIVRYWSDARAIKAWVGITTMMIGGLFVIDMSLLYTGTINNMFSPLRLILSSLFILASMLIVTMNHEVFDLEEKEKIVHRKV